MMEMMTPLALLALAEGFAGQALVVDERLRLPACERPALGWAAGAPARVEVRCDAPAWRVFLPVKTGQGGPPPYVPGLVRMVDGEAGTAALTKVRRGERVAVQVRGAGFVVWLDAVADGAAREGRLWVRVPETAGAASRGRRLLVRMGADGVLEIDGLNARVNGR
jgi:flagella basal body P-ring formation protein FlgA